MRATHAHLHIRRFLARHLSLYWLLAVGAAAACTSLVAARLDDVHAARASWGAERAVFVATGPVEPGDELGDAVAIRRLPRAAVPERALADVAPGAIARQAIDPGSIVTDADVAPHEGPLALVPTGWRAVAIHESPPSGARPGDRVDALSGGLVVAANALVVGTVADATLVAVPVRDAAAVALSGANGSIQLARAP